MVSTPENQLTEAVRKLQDEVASLRRGGYIPRLDRDPDEASGITLWMLHDGRLRGRLRSGSVQEWAKVTPGSAISTVAAPVADPIPKGYRYSEVANWAVVYSNNGGSIYNDPLNRLHYGFTPQANEFMSMIHFPNLSRVGSALRISRVQLRLSNIDAHGDIAEVRLGLHDSATAPGSFQQIIRPPYIVRVRRNSTGVWYDLPPEVGEQIRDRGLEGITIHQGSTNRALYGVMAGINTPGYLPPQLLIDYIE